MTSCYSVDFGYDEDVVRDFVRVYHDHYCNSDYYQPFDFTLTTSWGDAAERSGLAQSRRYIFLRDGNVVGLFQGLLQKIILYKTLRAGSTSGNGLAVLSDVSKNELWLFLQKVLTQEKVLSFSAFIPGSHGIGGFSQLANYTFYIRLDQDIAEIWQSMNKKTRNRIRKAEKLGVVVGFSRQPESLIEAYRVIDSSAEEKQISSPPWRWTVNLHESFQRQGLESIIFSARIGEKGVVSSAHLIGFDRKLALWKAGSTEEGYRSNAGSLVQSKIIEWAKDNGYVIYDMGGTDPRLPVYAGIHRFKSGFGGDLVANTILEKTPFFVRALRPAYGLLARIGLPYPR